MSRSECIHLVAIGTLTRCAHIDIFRPISDADCSTCPHYSGRFRGLGDVVHAVAKATGVAAVASALPFDCKCAQRRAALNAAVPIPDKAQGET